ncbi:hypothetical protein BDN67DRAFT_1010916 [Paxillus ammoniavirescens]|nr:hypothetical protein BDN67DRAFT_1010916 [Paxillus ammoniavirescens]
MRFSLVTIICALAAYATAVAVPGAADVFERDEDGCCSAGGVKICGYQYC